MGNNCSRGCVMQSPSSLTLPDHKNVATSSTQRITSLCLYIALFRQHPVNLIYLNFAVSIYKEDRAYFMDLPLRYFPTNSSNSETYTVGHSPGDTEEQDLDQLQIQPRRCEGFQLHRWRFGFPKSL